MFIPGYHDVQLKARTERFERNLKSTKEFFRQWKKEQIAEIEAEEKAAELLKKEAAQKAAELDRKSRYLRGPLKGCKHF